MKRLFFLFFLVMGFWFFLMAGGGDIRTTAGLDLLYGRENGRIVYLSSEEAHTLDPALATDIASARIISNIYEGLVRLRNDGDGIEPCLASRWEVSSDGLRWTFYLRPGVTFHDGSPCDANAVKFSIDRVLSPANKKQMPYADFVYGMVKEVKVVDKSTVSFLLKYPYAPFLYNLAMPFVAPVVSPEAVKKYGPDFWRNPVGTGPFRFVHWIDRQQIALDSYAGYWNGTPSIKGINVKIESDPEIRVRNLKRGRADIIEAIDQREMAPLESEKLKITKASGFDLSYLGFYTNKKPFDNPELRNAVAEAINRDELAKAFYQGKVVPAESLLPPGILGHNKNIKQPVFAIDKARQDLADNGHPDGLSMTMITYANPRPYSPLGGEKLAQAVKEQLAVIGIKTKIKVYPWDQFKAALLRQEGDCFLYGWTSDNGDPDNFLFTLLYSGQNSTGLNSSHYSSSEVDMLLLKAQRTADPKLRALLYEDAQKRIAGDVPILVLNHSLHSAALSPHISGFVLKPGGIPNFKDIKSALE